MQPTETTPATSAAVRPVHSSMHPAGHTVVPGPIATTAPEPPPAHCAGHPEALTTTRPAHQTRPVSHPAAVISGYPKVDLTPYPTAYASAYPAAHAPHSTARTAPCAPRRDPGRAPMPLPAVAGAGMPADPAHALHAPSRTASALAADVLSLAPAYILVCRPDGTIVTFNEACEKFTGKSADEVLGSPLVDVLPATEVDSVRAYWRRYITGASSSGRVEVRCAGPDGSPRVIRCYLRTLAGPDGRPDRVIVIGHDITADRLGVTQLRRRAATDALTGLVTRSVLISALAAATGRSHPSAADATGPPYPSVGQVLFADIDNFKAVNDAHGHSAGDAVLAEVADRLRRTVRRDDIVARFGGDEFVVFCPTLDDAAAQDLLGRLRMAVARPIVLGVTDSPEPVTVHVSIGAAAVTPGVDWRESLAAADKRMYDVKLAAATERVAEPAPASGRR